jgi:hypothetical protein
MATRPVKQVKAENYARYDASLQPELDFGPGAPVIRSTIDAMIADATYLTEVTKANLDYCVTSCMCPETLGSNSCAKCNDAKRKRMRSLLKNNVMRRQCGDASEQPFNDNGTNSLL